jgi:mitochondrial chaperone BCS1
MMVWLSKQPSWARAREVQVSTRQFGLNTTAVMIPGEDDDPAATALGSRKLAYLPSVSTTYSIWYKNRWMSINRTQNQTGYYGRKEETLEIRCVFICTLSVCFVILILVSKYFYKEP